MCERPTGRPDNSDRVSRVLPTFEYSSNPIVMSIMRQNQIIGSDGDGMCKPADRLPHRSSISPNPAITSWAPMMVVATWAIDNRFWVACERISS